MKASLALLVHFLQFMKNHSVEKKVFLVALEVK